MGVEIYVGHVSGSVTEDEVQKLFSVVGTVTSVHLVVDPASGESRGCGYVRMSTEEEAREAIDLLNGAKLGDSLIVVKGAPPKNFKKTGSSGGGRGGQGGHAGRG
ncbi:MAG: RNA-binding protein [Deltaproteobacteria bacterium]|nr:RNA-binding protein [Deltaproteobacteria bacterium]